MALTELNLIGTLKKSDGDSPSVATVAVTLNQVLFNSAEDIIIQPDTKTVNLAADGSFSVPIVATDDPDTTPTGGTYTVTITFDDGGKQVFTIIAPHAGGAGSNLDIMSVLQPGPGGTGAFFIPISAKGAANGVATLDSEGQLPTSQMHMDGEPTDVPGPLDGSGLIPTSQLPPLGGSLINSFFGDGSDGDVVLGAGLTTLTRNMNYHNLNVPVGATLDPAGFVVLISGTLSGGGHITADATNAVLDVHGLGGGGSVMMSVGDDGVSGSTAIGVASSSGPYRSSSGGAGGAGTAGAGGAANIANPRFNGANYDDLGVMGFIAGMINNYLNGGSSGSGGSGDGASGKGGGGGGGGGMLAIVAAIITFTGTITSKGGNGGDAASTNCGGGGGGGGGMLWVLTKTAVATYTNSVAGGTKGHAFGTPGTGVDGTDGGAGVYRHTVLAA